MIEEEEDEDDDAQKSLLSKYDSQARVTDQLVKAGEDKGEVCVLMDVIDQGDFERALMFTKRLKKNCNNQVAWDGYNKLEKELTKRIQSQG